MRQFAVQSLRGFQRVVAGIWLVGVAVWASSAVACPFCTAAMQTLSQEIESADVALIAELAQPMPVLPPDDAGAAAADAAAAKFRVLEVLRGEDKLTGAKEIDVVYFGQDPPKKQFLITGLAGVTGPGLDWTTPVPLSDRAVAYVRKLPTAPAGGADRLAFFQDHLEDEDPLLAQDAYDEFARTPYSDVVALGPRIQREKLLKWIDDASVGPSSRRLYLTLLGVCGRPEDVAMLEELLNYDYQAMKPGIAAVASTSGLASFAPGAGLVDEVMHAAERRKKESLDALIACYLKLKGPEGLALINKEYLGNPSVEYKHLHSALMALRFHGEETEVLPRDKLLESMRLALSHKEFADQVIPDLTRWEDWEVMPRLVKMFKDAPADDWIRQPVVSYLLVAAEQPGEVGADAQSAIKELEGLDAETVERARSLSAFSLMPRTTAARTGAADAAAPAIAPTAASAGDAKSKAAAGQEAPARADASASRSTADAALPAPSKIKIIGVPLLAAAMLLAIFAVLLRGSDPRSSNESA